MKVSIVIPTHNRLGLLKRTLYALSRLTYPRRDFEVVVVDDASEDGTHQFLRTLSPPYTYHFFRHAVNRHLSAARNTGIRHARGDLIVFLDDDMETIPHFLEEHVKFHSHGRRVAVMGDVQVAPGVPRTGIVRYLSTRGVHKLKSGQRVPFKYVLFSNASIPRLILFEVGLFDEQIVAYGGEDLELTFRLKTLGNIDFMYAPQAVSYHMHYRSLDDVCRLTFDYGRASLAYMIQKHPELAQTVKAHLMEPIRLKNDPLTLMAGKLLLKAAMNPLLYKAAKWYARKGTSGSPAFLYDFIIAYNYLTGLQHSLRDRKSTPARKKERRA